MAHILNAYRDIFYYQTSIEIVPILILILASIILLIIAYMVFNRLQKGFAEQL